MYGGNKKRRAEKQWRREEVEAGLDERDEPVIEGNGIQVASTEELSKRRFVRVGRRRGAPALEEATAAAPAPVFNFAAPAVAATTAAPEDEKEEKKEKEKEQTTQAAEQPEKVEKKEEKEEEEEKEEKEEEQKPSDEDKKETAKVDFGKTPENITVAQFSFGLPATSSPTTGGFVFGASSSTTSDSTAPATGFFFGAPAKTDSSEKTAEGKEEKRKEAAATWTCSCCTEVNPESNTSCSVCMVPRPAAPKVVEDGWTCACCTQLNPANNSSCSVCMVPKPL